MKAFGRWSVISLIRFIVQFAGCIFYLFAEILNQATLMHDEQKLTV